MRWVWPLVMVGMGCIERADAPDSGPIAHDAGGGVIDAGADAEEFDPCVWDGRGDNLCFAETGWVFDGTSCRSVCGALATEGRAGVFATEAQCRATCPCAPAKFIAFPPGTAGPLELGKHCDGLYSAAEEGAAPPWTALQCDSGGLPGTQYPRVCLLASQRLNRRAMARACRASVQPQVKQVVCYVWVD